VCPDDQGLPPDEVLAALVASLRQELADAAGALAETRAELGRARERIAELEARLKQNSRNSSRPPSSEGLAKTGAQGAVAAEEEPPQARRAGRA
jgi:transposase